MVSQASRFLAAGLAAALSAVAHPPVAGAQQAGQPNDPGDRNSTVVAKPTRKPDAAPPQDAGRAVVEATAASLYSDEKRTTFRLDLSKGVTAEIFTLANPYRVIVDLPDITFKLETGAGREGRGLVKEFRYGLFAENKARIVLETTGPIRIDRAEMVPGPERKGIVFTFDLIEIPAETFGLGTGARRSERAPAKSAALESEPPAKSKRSRPLVMIDPGHGGIDGGAMGGPQLLEKDLVLAVAKELRRALAAGGRYDVHMTRAKDVFVSLDQRLDASRSQGADLFISLHADSLADQAYVQAIRGATVYTLSERASDEQARVMAEKENASDLVAGLAASDSVEGDEVKNILIDLIRRETSNFSADFSNVLVGRLKRSVTLSRDPQRSAAFKVLKQSHTPSVLLELGYLSHPEDQKLLATPQWQRQAATSIAAAVDAFFAKRAAAAP